MPTIRRPENIEFDVRHRILIVGTGPAGVSAAQELRRRGFLGDLVMMGDELDGPYDRPACSKGVLTGHQRPGDVRLPVDPAFEINWRLGRRAVGCDLDRRFVEAHTGERVYFDGLVIATGTRPVVPVDWPDDQPGMHVISGLAAAWELRRDLRWARRVAVVGGGVTGCEVACAVRDMARQAVLVDPRPYLMGRAVGELVGGLIAESHRRAGIEMRLGRRVRQVERQRGRWWLTLDDSSTVEADLVVATMGERPDVEWLEGTGLDISDGVACDPALRALGAEGVVAAGSLTRWPNPRSGDRPVRIGQWIAAQEQGIAAARTLLAGNYPAPAASVLPRYWSYQHGLRIEVCGEPDPTAEMTVEELRPGRRDPVRSGLMVTYTQDERVVGAVAVNAPRVFTTMARMMLLDAPSAVVPVASPAPVAASVAAPDRIPAMAGGPQRPGIPVEAPVTAPVMRRRSAPRRYADRDERHLAAVG